METIHRQRLWQRIALLVVLGYEGAGALLGGSLLAAAPDGRLMDMPISLMHGAFRDFIIPGIILIGLGLLNVAAFYEVVRRRRTDWIAAGLALGGLAVWFFVEIVILRELHRLHAMWGLPVVLGMVAAVPLLPFGPATLRDIGLVCGIMSSLLYVLMNVLVPMQWSAYDSASQTVSELSAIAAPTRPLWVALGVIYTLLVTAFGWSVRMGAGTNRRLRVAGTLIAIYGGLGVIWPFAPMHLREALAARGGTLSDTLHIALGVATEIIYLLALGFAAVALGRAFRLYSIATFVILLAFGTLTFRDAPNIATRHPTPLIGLWERINIGVFLLWVIVLAVALLRGHSKVVRAPRHAIEQPA